MSFYVILEIFLFYQFFRLKSPVVDTGATKLRLARLALDDQGCQCVFDHERYIANILRREPSRQSFLGLC